MDAQSLIHVYQTGFYICVAVTILGIILSLILFFQFRIGNIWAIQSGKARKKAVRELQEASRQDGRMRADEARYFTGLDDEEQALKITAPLSPELQKTDLLQPESQLQQTTILQPDSAQKTFIITQQILLIHTDEKIE